MREPDVSMLFYKRFKLKYFWVFLTEKCNLNCGYCFYKHRDNLTTLSIDDFDAIINAVPAGKDSEFIISGGEPLLEFNLVKCIIRKIREYYPFNYILLQTNAILLNKKMIPALKRHNVNVEIGLDGSFCSNERGRNGTTHQKYNKIMNSIRLLKKNNIRFSCTMTVYPDEANKMFANYLFLLDKNFKSIEITPAAFEVWNRKGVISFKKEYLKCLRYSIGKRLRNKLSTGYDRIIKPSADAVITAHGDALLNWSFLSLPNNKKKRYSVFSSFKGKVNANKQRIAAYSSLLERFYSTRKSYREYSTLHAKAVYKELNNKTFKGYGEINDFLKKVNTKYLMKHQL